MATMGATLFSREVLGSLVDVTCVKMERGVLQLLAEKFARSPATKHKESCSFVSTKELDEKIEGTYLTELSLQADDVPTNAQSTRRLVLKH